MAMRNFKQPLFLVIALLLVTTSLPGCGSQPVRYITVPLPLPARPVLPAVTSADLMCISDDAYKRLITRDRLRREYAEELEVIIQSTQKAPLAKPHMR